MLADTHLPQLVWLGRRLALSLFLSVLQDSNPFQVALVTIVLLGSLVIQFRFKPFSKSIENRMEVVSLITTLCAYGSQVAISLDSSATASKVLTWILVAVIMLVCGAFVVALVLPRLHTFHRYLLRRFGRKETDLPDFFSQDPEPEDDLVVQKSSDK